MEQAAGSGDAAGGGGRGKGGASGGGRKATGPPPPGNLDGFGIVTLASLFPVALVLTMGLLLNATMSADDIRTIQRDEYGICT